MKRLLVVISLLTVFIALQGCGAFSDPAIIYDGKERPISEVEEIMGDKLEVENPSMDFDVTITNE